MSFIKKSWIRWKHNYNQVQKDKAFRKGIVSLPDVLQPLVPITGNAVHFSHTGHAGDVIYALPAMQALAAGREIHLYLELNQPNRDFTSKMKHPNGSVMLTERSVELFRPLMGSQPYIKHFGAKGDAPIHYDLTAFRAFPFDYRMYSIARWYFLTFGVTADLGKPWLHVTPDPRFQDRIVIARSSRYHAPGISYCFLQAYPEPVFVGVAEEYEAMKKDIPHLQYQPVSDFLELARVIAGSRLFIGNQSFPFALAEATKANRLLEVYHQVPNVVPEGPGAHDFCYQPQFEKIVADILNR